MMEEVLKVIKEELMLIKQSVLSVKWKGISAQTIKRELVSNGISLIIALLVTSGLSRFFVARTINNLWGLGSKKVRVNKDTMDFMETVLVFAVGLIVFTLIEQVMENYYRLKDKKEKEEGS